MYTYLFSCCKIFLTSSFIKKIIIIRGPLGVGKTTISKILAQNLQAEYISVDKVLSDNHLANGEEITLESFLEVNEIILELVNKSEKTFIVDGNFYYQEQIDDLKNKFKNNVDVFAIMSSIDKCIERDSKRERVYGEDSVRYIHMMIARIKEGFEIDSSDLTIQETVDKIMQKI